MKLFLSIILFLVTFSISAQKYKDGDIIFQSSISGQSKAVEEATNSPYSHCGIIFFDNGVPFVYEAVQPVGKRDLKSWIESGKNSEFKVMRLKDTSLLNHLPISKMREYASSQFDKNYDIYFGWSDKEWYCSELVWKTYKRIAGVELCKPKALKEFNIDAPIVRKTMAKRYGNEIPYDENMVSPGQLFDSGLLIEIK
jgi:uncharacterized protein YycO